MAILAEDTFDRSDRALAGDTASDGVSVWADRDGTGGCVKSNYGTAIATGWGAAYISGVDHADVRARVVTVDGDYGQVFARFKFTTAPSYSCYGCWMQSGLLHIKKVVDGVTSYLATSICAVSPGDTIAIVCVGSRISVERNGTEEGAFTDTAITSGSAGFECYSAKYVNDFYFESIVSPVRPMPVFLQQ